MNSCDFNHYKAWEKTLNGMQSFVYCFYSNSRSWQKMGQRIEWENPSAFLVKCAITATWLTPTWSYFSIRKICLPTSCVLGLWPYAFPNTLGLADTKKAQCMSGKDSKTSRDPKIYSATWLAPQILKISKLFSWPWQTCLWGAFWETLELCKDNDGL